MELMYQSTRSKGKEVTASQAILKGLADDGGLFVPVSIPKLDVSLDAISKMSYQETAYEVMKLFFTDFTEEELKKCIERAYDSKFDTTEIDIEDEAPVSRTIKATQIVVRTTEKEREALKAYFMKHGVSLSKGIKIAIKYLEQQEKKGLVHFSDIALY